MDGTVRIWDVRGGYVTHVFRPTSTIDGNDYDGSTATTTTTSGALRAVTGIQWLPDLQQLVIAIARDDGSICIHDLRNDRRQGKNSNGVVVTLRDHVSAVGRVETEFRFEADQHRAPLRSVH